MWWCGGQRRQQGRVQQRRPPLPRFLVAVVIAFAPIFLANMVFAQRFRDTGDSATAFGANLLGAMLGGVLEYLSLIIGYRWLLAVVALLYGLAFITGRGHLPASGRSPQPFRGSSMAQVARLACSAVAPAGRL